MCKNHKQDEFIQFIKFALYDFYANYERPVLIPKNEERTNSVEVSDPSFKDLANFTKELSFTWCENKSKSTVFGLHIMSMVVPKSSPKKF